MGVSQIGMGKAPPTFIPGMGKAPPPMPSLPTKLPLLITKARRHPLPPPPDWTGFYLGWGCRRRLAQKKPRHGIRCRRQARLALSRSPAASAVRDSSAALMAVTIGNSDRNGSPVSRVIGRGPKPPVEFRSHGRLSRALLLFQAP